MNTAIVRFFTLSMLFSFLFTTISSAQYGRMNWRQRSSIDLIVGGDFGFRLIDGNSADPQVQQMMSNREDHENQKLNYRFGFNYYQGLTPALSLKTGLRFANPGFIINSVESFDLEQDINEVEKEFTLWGPEYKYDYQMIEIPLGAKYTLIGTTCEPYFEAGIAPTFYRQTLVREVGFEEAYRSKTKVQEAIREVNFIGFASVGGNMNLSDNMSSFIQMVGRYQLNDLREGPIVERIISMGLEAGVRYYW